MKIFCGKTLHIHFKCIKCNSIIDIDSRFLDLDYLKLYNKIPKEGSLLYLMLIGLRNKCREDENGKTN